ncbi:uncharacterized protein LOC118732625 [Rhagoletis pomonella]|uniref:uncharacterized protein LOC118732625 n=1 Tax=Rhagoletis pomonella TaxID=28610 RepID=UPI00177DC5A3|nr:uncharacterized protein LOC118732625 [Rhagoletis pomonella]
MSFLEGVKSTRTTIGSLPKDFEECNTSTYTDVDEESTAISETPSSSSRRRKEDDKNKFHEFLELAASNISHVCSEFSSERQEQDSTALHFLSLSKKIKEAGLPTNIVNRIEARVSSLVFSEIQSHLETIEAEFYYEGE